MFPDRELSEEEGLGMANEWVNLGRGRKQQKKQRAAEAQLWRLFLGGCADSWLYLRAICARRADGEVSYYPLKAEEWTRGHGTLALGPGI